MDGPGYYPWSQIIMVNGSVSQCSAQICNYKYKKHLFIKLTWLDIVGSSSLCTDYEFGKLKCATIITEAYLYEIFEDDGIECVRTFASYQNEDDIGYGDCNVYPMSVFTKSSQRAIRKAWKQMSKG